MAEIVSFMVCNSINNIPTPDNVMVSNIVSPQIVLRPQFIPGNFSFGVAIGIAGVDLSKPNKIRFQINGPDGKSVHDSGESDVPGDRPDDILPAKYQGFVICLDIRNFVIEQQGEYQFLLYLNGEKIGTNIIPIFKNQ